MLRVRCGGTLAACLLTLGLSCARPGEDVALRRGIILYKSGKYNDAIAELRIRLRRNPRDGEALLWLGKAHSRLSELDKAIELLEKGVEVLPANEDAWGELVCACLGLHAHERERGEAERARAWLEKADGAAKSLLNLPPRQGQSYAVLVRLAECKAQRFRAAGRPEKEREMYDEALGYCEKVLELEPRDIPCLDDRSRILFDLRRFREAERSCNEVLKINPRLCEPKLMIARIRRVEGDYEGAIKILSELLAGKRSHVGALLGRAEIYLDLQKYDEALADANAVLSLNNKSPYANYIRGSVYMQTTKLDEAIAELQIAAAGMPRHLMSHFWLARCLLLKDRLREAIEELNVVVKLDPRFNPARMALVSALTQGGHPDEAIAILTDSLRFDAKNSEVYRLLAMAHLQKGEQERARQMFEKMLALDDIPARAPQLLGLGGLTRGETDKAIEQCLEALKVEPENVDVRFLLGLAYLRKESLDEAKAQFEEVVKLRGGHVAARLRLAEIHARQGQYDKAQAELEKLLTLDTEKAKVQRALDALRRQRAGSARK